MRRSGRVGPSDIERHHRHTFATPPPDAPPGAARTAPACAGSSTARSARSGRRVRTVPTSISTSPRESGGVSTRPACARAGAYTLWRPPPRSLPRGPQPPPPPPPPPRPQAPPLRLHPRHLRLIALGEGAGLLP